jgi:hypothetical protein
MKAYFIRLRNAFTLRFIFLLFITQCFIKGIVFVIFTNGVFPLLKLMGVDAVQVQVYGALAMSPWTVKPLLGVLSDLIAIGGYHKRYWMLGSIVIGITGAALMVVDIRTPVVIVTFLIMIHFEIAVTDLLMEGQYAEMMRKNPHTGSDIVTLSNGFQQFGFIIGMCFIGPLADVGLFRVSNIIALVLCATPIIPILLGFLPEVKRVAAPLVLVDTLRIRKDWRIVVVVALTGISAPAMAAISVFASKWLGLTCSAIVISVAALGGFFAFDNPIIARVALYQILAQVSKISFASALDFFFTADQVCLPGGPAFGYKFYITTTGIASAVSSFAVVFLYQLLFSKWRFRSVILFTTILSGVGGVFDFIIIKRWNLAWGIPDAVFFLIGDDIIHSMVDMLYWIPSSAIIGKVCPENMESCTYAYLAGVSNFGRMMSIICGAMLTELAGIVTVGPNCYWGNLEYLVLGGHVMVMLAVSIPASWLIPNEPQDANLLKEVSEAVEMEEEKLGQDVLLI